ncbi:probable glycosyltransferase At5g03795 [Elaeis guineensis]|uniref:Probable glycosyltransferase At5g03795 n=1 Tax=Elaeis guineensis var. tenera TaxID=51953 RepID=A0A6I9SAH9_ELAGV|nr:probable glycosyltransferase At5g03795 [Elaeis guineensis]
MEAIGLWKAATRRLGGAGVAGRWRRDIVAVALVVSAAAVILSFSAPYPVSVWFPPPSAVSFSHRTASSFSSSSSAVAGGDSSFDGSLLPPSNPIPIPPPSLSSFLQYEEPVASASTPPPSSLVAPLSSSDENSDDEEVEDSGGDLKMPPLWRKPGDASHSTDSTATTVPPPVVASPPPISKSDAVEGKSSTGEPKVPPLLPQIPVWLMSPDQQLIYAKREIDHAPLVLDDPDLYAPLFRNVSVFKRSYELMERILKVYIYKDGSRPIFHFPDLKGIYASEGWFMKLMEGNKQFVVKDGKKAHLFYLPYGARQLELTLYRPDSHNINDLLIFLRDYINMISAKYPYWNRTRGTDHFFVACHDWGPYTTKLHDEFKRNTIKALCNADVSEGVFIRGKDVSLPETYIRTPRRPLRDVGGKPVSQRSILAFFAGQMHGRVRPILIQYWRGKDADMRIYEALPHRVAKKMSYIQHMKTSKFCICPMGYEVNSPRIVEAIYYECVPVIIADNFVLPFDEVLDWSAFSVVVAEKDIPNLKDILLKIPLRQYITMQMNVKRLQKHFLWHAKPIKYDIFHMILHSVWFNRLNQIQV